MTYKFARVSKSLSLALAATAAWCGGMLPANALNLAQTPLFLTATQPPLIMMTMARDHKLYYEAYNDYSDLDGDGTLDMFYTPSIEYYGYFDSYKCYNYSSTDGRFTPVAVTANKKCTGTNDAYWSGDYLNYLTTSRMDALRKVFFGGKRSVDTATETVLERAFVPQDAHSWGKEYASVARDGYDISEYTPLGLPVNGTRHLFANVTLTSDTSPPLLRVLNDSKYRIWEWVSIERPVAGGKCMNGGSGPSCETAGGSEWSIVPSSTTEGLSNLTMTTYNTGTAASPASEAAFDTFESTTYGITARKCGTGTVSVIDGTGNPYEPGAPTTGTCANSDNYMSIFAGTLNIPTDGTYTFGIDGDDAVDLIIDNKQRIGWYGGHSATGAPPQHTDPVTLAAGPHTIKFRHHEQTGGDSYHLYWQKTVPASAFADYNVRVEVCKKIVGVSATYNEGLESNCQGYGSEPVTYKPTGLLHKYGQNDGMYFGLITGSYDQNTDGGVLRKEVGTFTNEIEASTGIFKETGSTCGETGTSACSKGIVGTINRLKITSFNYSNQTYSCGWVTTHAMNDGQCEMWGNPLGEMMYEGLRYFAGKDAATSAYTTASTRDNALGLPKITWNATTNPYGSGKYPTCARPYLMLISDVYPSFDSDKIQGADSNFSSFTGDLTGLSVSTQGQSIWDLEFSASESKGIFIGQVGDIYNGAPTVKTATSFGNIRGLAPSEPTRQGSYYAASISFFGRTHDLNGADGQQSTSTYSIALASPLPRIEIPVDGKKVVFVPFAKSVGGESISAKEGDFQPTNQIVDFYVDTINNTTTKNANAAINEGRPYYKFRINYEDVEQGADHDMDAIVTYEVKLNADNTITVNLSSDYAAGGIIQHMGYVISGTTTDGVFLEVRDKDTAAASDPDYFLDTPKTTGTALPLSSSHTFTPSATSTAGTILQDPLWYAAKFGGFTGNAESALLQSQWDADNDGIPDNYFLVVNPLKMLKQMDDALAKIGKDAKGTSAALATSSFSFQEDTLLYQGMFDSAVWSGELNAYAATADGLSTSSLSWHAQEELATKAPTARNILTYDVDKTSDRGIAFDWSAMTASGTLRTALNKKSNGTVDALGSDRLSYLRGTAVTGMRTRPPVAVTKADGTSTIISGSLNRLGDIINSQAQYVAAPSMGFGDESYVNFWVDKKDRTKMLYVGANDGMLHGFSATSGEELLAYVPSEMYRVRNGQQLLSKLTETDYGEKSNPHQYYVDGTPTIGDICSGTCTAASDWKTILVGGLNGGGQGIYALDVTNPDTFATTGASSIVKWEFLDHDHDGTTSPGSISGDAELGYTYSRPFIVKLCTAGTAPSCTAYGWYVIFGNGYNNTEADGYAGTGDAVLYVLDADTGYLVKKIALGVADGANPNGLAEVTPIDKNGDGLVDYVYAGDLKGNMWRVDFTSSLVSAWEPAFGAATPLYVAKDEAATPQRQAITTAPDVISHPKGGVLVVFGTGSYLATNDPTSTQTQTMYGIWDRMNGSTVASSNRNNLQAQETISATVTLANTITLEGTDFTTNQVYRTVTANVVDWETKDGWYMNLIENGERISFNPQIISGKVLKFTSTIPSADPCAGGGTSWDYYTNVFTGGRLDWAIFTNFTSVPVFNGTSAFASAVKSNIGITAAGTPISQGHGISQVFKGGTGPGGPEGPDKPPFSKDSVRLGNSRISWREILND